MKTILLAVTALTVLSLTSLHAADTNNETVLIAMEKGLFFDDIVGRIKPALSDRGVPCIVSDMKSLDDSKLGKYLCVLIMSSIKGDAPNNRATAFFKRLNEKEKRKVLLVAASDKPWKPTFHGVDVIIASPKADKGDSVSAAILTRIDARLELNRGETAPDTTTRPVRE